MDGSRGVLIVDDHAGFRASARLLLESLGWTVAGEAADAASGLTAALALRPSALMVDVDLPDASGFSLARAVAGWDAPPVVMMVSSRDDGGYAAAAAECGARCFVPKDALTGECLTRWLAP
ncbi:MAG: response regulator transcription factor [Thermoleophilia bacterium]